MHFFYVDESYDTQRFVMSALRVRAEEWREVFGRTKDFRAYLRSEFGVKLKTELHAQTFVRHCSDRSSDRKLSLADRRKIFGETIEFVAALPIEIINVSLSVPQHGDSNAAHLAALDRLFNRINTNVSRCSPSSHAVVIFDSGKEQQTTRLARRLSVFNHIPSQFDQWPDGRRTRNIVTDRIVEDPVFRDSKASYFLQLADFVAFALLKREVAPTDFVAKWGYHEVFRSLQPVLCIQAHRRDPLGIVRA